jgi:hypothetical protein
MEVSMKKQGLVLAMLAMALTFGLVFAGCGEADDGDDGSGDKPLTLSDFVGTYGNGPVYDNGLFTVKDVSGGYDLTVTANSLIAKSTDGATTAGTISGVTTEGGGDIPGNRGKWLYLVAGGKRIGVAYKANGGTLFIYLGKTATTTFEYVNDSLVSTEGVEDGAITGIGGKV